MLSDDELELYMSEHRLSPTAKDYIRNTRSTDPSRPVGLYARNNVSGAYASERNGVTIQVESRSAEMAFVIECEFSANVLEFWDQPPPVPVIRTDKAGRPRNGSYTTDFLVLKRTGPVVVETKPFKKLEGLVERNPTDWVVNGDVWEYLPGKRAFAALGLRHEVVSTAQLNPIRTSNLTLLHQARRSQCEPNDALRSRISTILSEHAWIRLADLMAESSQVDTTPILVMIANGEIHAAIDVEFLSQQESAWIALTKELIEAALLTSSEERAKASIHEWSVSRDFVPTQKQAERAIRTLKLLESGDKGRTARRYKKKLRDAGVGDEAIFELLIPKTNRSGNRTPRLNPVVSKVLGEYLTGKYATPNRITKTMGYAQYKVVAKDKHPEYPPVSEPTFRKARTGKSKVEIAEGRGGVRAANAAEPASPVDERVITPSRAFEMATIDHYLANIMLIVVSSNGVAYVARPWISVMVDIFSGSELAVWVSFRNPSTRTCAMLIRRCVRKHGRLPESIIVDRGPDFRSVYFSALAAHCRVHLLKRPSGHPRYGSEAERFFGYFQTKWLSLRPGNFAEPTESRCVSASHSPQKNATLDIEVFYRELLQFLEWRDATIVGTEKVPPGQMLRDSLRRFSCSGVVHEESDEFIVATAVDVRKYSVDPVRGINTGEGRYYWSPSLLKLATTRKKPEVRMEPENPYVIYVNVANQWVSCFASNAQKFASLGLVERLSEATRLLDGRKARDLAKQEADMALVKLARTLDEDLVPKVEIQCPVLSDTAAACANDVATASGETEDDEVVAPLITTTWRR